MIYCPKCGEATGWLGPSDYKREIARLTAERDRLRNYRKNARRAYRNLQAAYNRLWLSYAAKSPSLWYEKNANQTERPEE